MSSATDTDHLIHDLARQIGTERRRAALPFELVLLLSAIFALTALVGVVLLVFGIRPDMAAYLQGTPFHFKVASTLCLACGAFILARSAGQPGRDNTLAVLALVPGLALLVLYAADVAGPILGRSIYSVPICITSILLLSLPALAIVLSALRIGAPTNPTLAGATAGLLAGALATAAYTLACQNDGGLHVALWYCTSILLVAAIGAAVGRRTLAW
jgi:hypothetical protein